MYRQLTWKLIKRIGTGILLAGGARYYLGFVEPLVDDLIDSRPASHLEYLIEPVEPQSPYHLDGLVEVDYGTPK